VGIYAAVAEKRQALPAAKDGPPVRADYREPHLPNLGDVQLRELNQQTIKRFYGDLLIHNVGVRTVRYVHAVIHRALEKAVMYGLLVRNSAHGAALPHLRHQEMSVLDESQVSIFLTAASGSHYEALYHLAVVTGMREGELFGLKWSDLQWKAGVIYVQRQVQRVPKQGWSFIEPKTRSGRRPIRLGPGTLDALRRYKERQELEKEALGKRWKDHDLIFPNQVGNPLEPSNMRKIYNRILEEAGIHRLRFHDLRHTAASIMLNHGVPVIVVSKILGHANPSITLNVYGHLYHESQEGAAKLMDELITPIRVELPPKSDPEVPGNLNEANRDLHQNKEPAKKIGLLHQHIWGTAYPHRYI
jgi:integrase